MLKEHDHDKRGSNLKDIILGGQDGLVNVLGVILGVAVATFNTKIIIVAGLAATFAESISMAAVAYTSTKAALSYYLSQLKKEEKEIEQIPKLEKKEVYNIYSKKGFRGRLLNQIVNKITSNRKIWLETMMIEELGISPREYSKPGKSAFIVGLSAVIGSLIPLLPFFFLPVKLGIIVASGLAALTLFITGMIKAKLTVGSKFRSGLEMLIIGMLAALAGYLIGVLFGNVNF
ncbi:MAG: VIT1/CCC1 transporter family protein [Nanoarchaeota archaeon]